MDMAVKKSILDWLFALPPAKRRWMPGPNFPLRFFFREPEFRKECDDTYIYYLTARTTFVICALFSVLNYLSHALSMTFNFYFFVIDLTDPGYAKKLLMTYTYYTATILLFIVLPYYIALFRYHFNPRTFDVTWWNPRPIKLKTMNSAEKWRTGIVVFPSLILGMYYLFAWPAIYMESGGLENSYPFFVFCLVILPFFFSLFSRAWIILTMVFWRYSGERSG
jgi:hypothetical protein